MLDVDVTPVICTAIFHLFKRIENKHIDFYFQPCYENIFIAHDYVCGKYGGIVTPEVGFMTIC